MQLPSVFIGFIFSLLFVAFVMSLAMRNPYKLKLIVGEKGSGKTAYLARLCKKWNKKKMGLVYSNCGLGLELQPEYWKEDYPPKSLLLIDEIGLMHNNRDYKKFDSATNEFYKYQRKNKLVIVVTSQNMDFDKKLRILTDYICVARRFLCFGYVKRYRQKITLVDDMEAGGKKLAQTEVPCGYEAFYFLPGVFNLFDTLKKAANIGNR